MNLINIFKLHIDDKRIFGLDVLRMLAVMFVVFEHSFNILPSKLFSIINYLYFDGVVIFFVLSGFLIGTILIRLIEKNGFERHDLINFWIRRWTRTLPNYFLFLIILAILNKVFITGFALKVVPIYFIFSQNLFNGIKYGFFGESWSLSVEEWFYISIPLLIFCSLKLFKISLNRTITTILILSFLGSIVMRFYLFNNDVIYHMRDYNRTVLLRMDNILYGVLGAYLHFYHKDLWIKHKKKFFIIGLLFLVTWKFLYFQYPDRNGFFYANFFYPLLCTGILCLLPVMNSFSVKKQNILSLIITYISLISYSLYLIHYSFMKKIILDTLLSSAIDESLTAVFLKNIIYWGGSFLGALLIYKYFEIPMMNLRNRLKISRK